MFSNGPDVVSVLVVVVPLAKVPDALRSVRLLMLLLCVLAAFPSHIPILLKLITYSFIMLVSLIKCAFNANGAPLDI